MGPAADAFARIHGPGDRDQSAALFADPFFQQFQLRRAEGLPVRVEGHDAIVVVHFLARGGEVVEDFLGLLRDARLARLQQHVDRRRVIAEELVAEEVVVAHRPAGQQQDVVLAADDLDVGLARVVGQVSVARRGLDAETQGPPAGGVRGQLELDRQHFAVGPQGNLPGLDHVAGAAFGALAPLPAGRPSSCTVTTFPAMPWACT